MSVAVRPGSLIWDVLRLVVENPGEMTVDGLVRCLRLVEPRPVPVTERPVTQIGQWRAEMAERARAERVAREEARARVTRALGRLVEAGFVEKLRPPRLSREFIARAERYGTAEALCFFHPAFPESPPVTEMPGYLALVQEVEKLPGSALALLGRAPSGAVQQRYADLVRWGVVVSPKQRWATERGAELVRSAGRRCA